LSFPLATTNSFGEVPSMFPRIIPALFAALALLVVARADPPATNRFEKEIVAYETTDKTNPPPPGAIIFTGASGIRRWNTLSQDFPGLTVINRGFGGSQISDSVYYADRIVIPYHPKAVVIQAGGNDIAAGKTPEQVLADFQAWVVKIRAALPDVRLVYLGQGPSPARWAQREKQQQANQLIRDDIAKQKYIFFVDIWPACLGTDGQPRPELFVADKLHPSPEQYQIRAKLLRPTLEP
jgi:lysophospholipase L1-like esterase